MTRHVRAPALVVTVAGMLLAACSSSSTGDGIEPTAPSATATDQGATAEGSAPAEDADRRAETEEPSDAANDGSDGDAGSGATPAYASGSADHLFDDTLLHTFEIDVPEESLAQIDADPTAEEYVEGSLTFEDETVAPIGVRYKGSVGAFVFCTDGPNPLEPTGAKTCRKLSMKLKMNWVDSNDEFFGVRRIQLHAQNLDPSKMHERLGYWVFREMGVPAPRSTHARVVLNGEYLGLFALTEQIDGRFTRDRFDDGTGNLYKEVWPLDAAGDPVDDDTFIDALRTNEDESPSAELIAGFARDIADASSDERRAVIERWTDLDTLLTTVVVDRAIKNDDGPIHWYCFDGGCSPHNFYWYEDPTAGRLTLIPWDLDNAFDNLTDDGTSGAVTRIADEFGQISADCEPFAFGPLRLLQRSAACDPILGALSELTDDYDRIRAELLAGPLSEERVNARLDAWSEQIEPAVAESAERFDDAVSVADWRAAVDRLRADLAAARTTSGR